MKAGKTRGIRIPDAYWEKLEKIAEQNGAKVSGLIRVAIERQYDLKNATVEQGA